MSRAAVVAVVLVSGSLLGQPVGSEFRVNTFTTSNQQWPAVGALSGSGFLVVWTSIGQDGPGQSVFGQRFTAGGSPLGAEFPVPVDSSSNERFPMVAGNASGSFVVCWEHNSNLVQSGYDVFARRFSSSGVPLGGDIAVNLITADSQYGSVAAIASGGGFVVIWTSSFTGAQDGSKSGVYARRFSSSGVALGDDFRVNRYTTNYQRAESVSSDSAGNFVVVWRSMSQDSPSYDVFGQRFASSGVPLGAEFRVNTFTTGYQDYGSVAAAPNGAFVVVWESDGQDLSKTGVFAQRFASDGSPLGSEFQVNAFTTDYQFYPKVSMDSSGSFVVLWEGGSQDGSGYGVFARRYASGGAPIGGEFRINTYTSGTQGYPALAVDAAGGFLVAWHSDGQDGDAKGIFAQVYCSTLTGVTISLNGSSSVCPTGTGGTATVSDTGGGAPTHVWGYRTSPAGMINPIAAETGPTYLLKGSDFPGTGTYYVVCTSTPTPGCGASTVSNNVTIGVTVNDSTAPTVMPPSASTVTQSLCQ